MVCIKIKSKQNDYMSSPALVNIMWIMNTDRVSTIWKYCQWYNIRNKY